MDKIIIYGTGILGRMLLSDIEHFGGVEPVAFTADREYVKENTYLGLPVIPLDSIKEQYACAEYKLIELCGLPTMRARAACYQKAKSLGYEMTNYVSRGAYLESEPEMGDNNVVFAGARLGFGGKMGCGNLIRQNVYIGHEFIMGSHNIISVGCTLASRSQIGNMCYFGLSVTASGGKHFGDECLIGMGSVVTKDVAPYATAYGNPARTASYHEENGIILSEL